MIDKRPPQRIARRRRSAEELGRAEHGLLDGKDVILPPDAVETINVYFSPSANKTYVAVNSIFDRRPELLDDETISVMAERIEHTLRKVRTEGLARKGKLTQ